MRVSNRLNKQARTYIDHLNENWKQYLKIKKINNNNINNNTDNNRIIK